MGTAIRKTAEKSSEKLFELMKFRTIPNFRLTDLSLYHIMILLEYGAFVLRARTPSLHQRVVLHDKGPGGVLPPRDVILAHEIIAQRRSVSKAQQDEAYPLAVAEAHAAFSPLRLHGPHMAPDLRFHGGIQRAEIVQTAPAQCFRIGLQRFLVHEQHILARVEVGVLPKREELLEQAHGGDAAVIPRKGSVLRCPQILHLIRVVLCLRYPRCFKALREPLRAHAVVEAVHATEKVLHALLRHPRVGEQPFQKLPRRTIVQFRIFDRVRRRTLLGRAVLPAAARERGNDKRDTEQQRRVPLLYFRGFDLSFLFADKHQCVYHTL